MALPDFFLIGAPKAGTTALHAALSRHPRLHLSPVKEPKFFLCDGIPPRGHAGPGDAHSAREWIWRRDRYEALFAGAPAGALRGESTPFYLHDPRAHERLRALVPEARLIALLRDPVDRAHSNWLHLWSDGLEPIPDLPAACRAEEGRARAGWAPFWHYRGLGRYGEQLEHLYSLFDPAQVHVLRYRQLVDQPEATLDGIAEFLGVERGLARPPTPENVRPFVPDTPRTRRLARAVRIGARVGARLPPRVWRVAARPLTRALQRHGTARPRLTAAERAEVLAPLVGDIRRLERVTAESFADWLSGEGRGEFSARRPDALTAEIAGG
jgi:Sulfotransferase family